MDIELGLIKEGGGLPLGERQRESESVCVWLNANSSKTTRKHAAFTLQQHHTHTFMCASVCLLLRAVLILLFTPL